MFRRKQQNGQEIDLAQRDAKVNELRAALGPLSGRKAKYCTDGCLRRYLEARNWNVDKATKMLEETLKWRATYKPEQTRWVFDCNNASPSFVSCCWITSYGIWVVAHWNYSVAAQHEIAHEGETGKVFRANFRDRAGRTVLIMRPGMQNTNCAEDNIRHLVYLIENSILNLPEGQDQMSWLIDLSGFSLNTNVSMRTAREIINILQNHYPERLALAFLYSPPRIFEAFWKAVKYFLDPKTSQKVKFVYPNKKESVELMSSLFDADNLPKEFGGKATLQYDHAEFSHMMVQDDVRTAKFWGSDEKPIPISSSLAVNQVAPEPLPLAPAAS
ncbi:unnamed protein product [Linum tenue]|uniref:CRAL-TRIO domain-containing protein n=1 Tax=Linum tenue TaxID=586396 RepID=A0AAV0KE46_9ROSI|nr:unnamed protein product [Linum tenue]